MARSRVVKQPHVQEGFSRDALAARRCLPGRYFYTPDWWRIERRPVLAEEKYRPRGHCLDGGI